MSSFNPIDFEKKIWTINKEKSSHFKLKICISCLHNTICTCGKIFMKLTQYVYILNSLNSIDFEKNGISVREK